jgi:hypothetical protein
MTNNTITTMDGTTVRRINVRLVTREQREEMENTVMTFVETYKGKNENAMDFPASIFTLCDYIITTKREDVKWKAVADMFRCFATEINSPFDKVFVSAGSSVTFFESLGGYRFQSVYNDVYSSLIHRVKTLKAECVKVLMEKCNN